MSLTASPVKPALPHPEHSADYRRIARAIDFIRSQAGSQPSLAEVAAAIGLSPFHLQRLFSRWAGISPKRFLQALTVEHAKARLRDRADVLTATLDVGLSSPGRLHDLFVALEAMTPGEYKERGAGLAIRHGFGPTPLGTCFVASTGRGICALEFADSPSDRAEITSRFQREWSQARRQEDPGAAAATLARVFARGSRPAQPLSVLVRGTNFQIQVWRALLEIPRGTATTYLGVARQIGRPTATRAVAGAVAANRVGILIPCHRVLRHDGRLGGYRWGETRKLAALLWESRAGAELFRPARR
jgi:AraC family transcriptional regulator of adaptative response/methylated-DNA-[protein]-cysteine methyltransferase